MRLDFLSSAKRITLRLFSLVQQLYFSIRFRWYRTRNDLLLGTIVFRSKFCQFCRSLWRNVVLPGARLQTRLWRPNESTCEPQRHWWGTRRLRASRIPTATLPSLSSSFRPHEAIGRACCQCSLLPFVAAALNAACWSGADQTLL